MSDDTFFPDLFVLWDVINRDEMAALSVVATHGEVNAALFEHHPRMLMQLVSGGRDAWVIPKKSLGSEYQTDFMIAQKSSGGPVWYAVELERPQAKIFTKKGDPSAI